MKIHDLLFKLFIIWLVTVLIGCSASQVEEKNIPKEIRNLENLTMYQRPENPDTLILHREQAFGNTDSMLIDIVGSIAVDDSGRVYLTAGRPNGIKIFDPDGRYLNHIGRKGRGPGEFATTPALYIISNRLYAIDYMAYRISVFSDDSLS